MSIVRLRDEFRWYVDFILKHHYLNANANPSYILMKMLQHYISTSNDATIAKKMLAILKPNLFPEHFKLFVPASSHNFPKPFPASSRKEDQDLICFIEHLNKNPAMIPARSNLAKLMGAFFSLYEHYRIRCSNELVSRLAIADVWNVYISRYVDTMVKETLSDYENKSSAFNALTQLTNWIPCDQYAAISETITANLKKNSVSINRDVMTCIVNFKEWIQEEKRPIILNYLFNCIYHETAFDNPSRRTLACDTIVRVQEWVSPERKEELYQFSLAKMKQTSIETRDVIFSVVGIMFAIFPEDKQIEMLEIMLKGLRGKHAVTKNTMLKALGLVKCCIPENMRETVINAILENLDSDNKMLCILSLNALLALCEMIDAKKCDDIMEKLRGKIKIYQRNLLIITAILDIFRRIQKKLSSEKYVHVISDITLMLLDKNSVKIKKKAIKTLVELHDRIPIECHSPIIDYLRKLVSTNSNELYFRLTGLRAIGRLLQLISEEQIDEKIKEAISDELKMILQNTNESIFLRLESCATLHRLNSSISDDTRVALLKDFLNDDNNVFWNKLSEHQTLLNEFYVAADFNNLIHYLLMRLEEDNLKLKSKVIMLLDFFKDKMDSNQKVMCMCRLLRLSSNEPKHQHEAKMLFINMYTSFRNELVATMVFHAQSEEGHQLPMEMCEAIIKRTL